MKKKFVENIELPVSLKEISLQTQETLVVFTGE